MPDMKSSDTALVRWGGITMALIVSAGIAVAAMAASGRGAAAGEPRADVVIIAGLKSFGPLERSPVLFLHDKHTEALDKKGRDCSACHKREKDRLVARYMRTEDVGRQEVMRVYHDNCIACHTDMLAKAEKSGPVTCGGCHRGETGVISVRQPMGLDKSLHFRHSKAQENKCERCHHEYNAQEKKLFYAKGQESTCRYCHGAQSVENRSSMRLASHAACIECHGRQIAQKLPSGPIRCAGCHDAKAQAAIEKVASVPRLERGQPDALFVSTAAPGKPAAPPPGEAAPKRMLQVPFDHKAHEVASQNCRVCHHAAMAACSSCHTLEGDAQKGKGITLAGAMHRTGSDTGCVGCHNNTQLEPRCAGCHAAIPQRSAMDESGCRSCHQAPAVDGAPAPEAERARAAALLAARTPMRTTYAEADIPEKVIIKSLAQKYQPAEMPHRKIVAALVKASAESKLAGFFHQDPGTLCQGCHHHSPPSKQPPHCSNCHGKSFDSSKPLAPGLMGAYHQQCIGCHDEMKLAKPVATDCTACHKEKNS
jgi:hypothetical protein